MGELVFIGLGLDDERGITLRGLDEARAADMVFAEFYTSALQGASIEAVEKLIDRQIRRLSRKEVEDGQVLLARLQTVRWRSWFPAIRCRPRLTSTSVSGRKRRRFARGSSTEFPS